MCEDGQLQNDDQLIEIETRYLYLGGSNPMAQVLSLYDKWLPKNQNFRQKIHNFRRQVVEIRLKLSQWNGIYAAVLLGSLSTTTQCSEPYG